MGYSFFDQLIVRTPLYSVQQYYAADFTQLLKNEEFQAALYLASISFFAELEKKQFDFTSLNAKQKLTVRKYMNRACFRSTPFGLFSSFSLVKWKEDASIIRLATAATPYIKPDFSLLEKLWKNYLKTQTGSGVHFQPNPSLYFSSVDIRYVRRDFDNNGQANFSMVSVAKNPFLKKLLKFCAHGKSFNDMKNYLVSNTGVDKDDGEEFIRKLIDEQILFSNNRPNITGHDYTEIFLRYFNETYAGLPAIDLADHIGKLNAACCPDIDVLKAIAKNLLSHSGNDEQKHIFYAVAERKSFHGGLPVRFQQKIIEGLHCLQLLSSTYVPADLVEFKRSFRARYETEEVPLLLVLDAQFGIGYGAFDRIKNQHSSYNSYNRLQSTATDNDERRSLAIILNEWQFRKDRERSYEIEITDDQLVRIGSAKTRTRFPPGISVMFRITGEDVFIENAGGNSALSLLGRFSYSDEVCSFAKEIAKKEQELNPNIVFTEIAHIGDLHSANINRVAHLRDYEIPVLASSIADPEKQIQLADIMVSVADDRVLLRSKKLGKVIIPRLSSAYNYTKSVFPVFRFLCEVQNQQLTTDLSLSLSSVLPGLSFYPRIRYKSCILQIAEWHFKSEQLEFLKDRNPAEVQGYFDQFANEQRLPRYFTYSYYDNFLVFDKQNPEEVLFFLNEIKGKDTVVIKEFPFIHHSLVENESNQRLLPQYVASLYLDKEVYEKKDDYTQERIKEQTTKKARDWLYFKIYCHPLTSDTILCDHLFPLIARYSKAGQIRKWFWVRYQDPDYHIRFRIKPDQNKRAHLHGKFNDSLVKLCNTGLVQRIQADIYKQETGRYSNELMEHVESVFHCSSNMIASMLEKKEVMQWNEDKMLIEAVQSIEKILEAVLFLPGQKLEFSRSRFYEFFHEFGNPKDVKLEMESLHKRLFPMIRQRLKEKEEDHFSTLMQNHIRLIAENCRKKIIRTVSIEKLTADMIHMHMNRLFTYDQRYFEMLVYYLAQRTYAVEIFTGNAS